jgi:aarF domain-containing kinase
LKVRTTKDDGTAQLGYLDFGLVSSVPQSFRDGVVCATVQLVFARNIHAVADLCVDLGLLPRAKLEDDPVERQQFVSALQNAFDEILVWPKDQKGRSTAVPKLCSFSQGLAAMTKLITSYEFTVPPYFLNNCRALATLEGIALTLDPNFNILRVIYPYAINQLMCNPRVSRKTEETFLDICRSSDTKLVDYPQAMMLLNDWSILTGYPKRKVFWDLATSIGGRRVSRAIVRDFFRKRFRTVRAWWWWFIRRRLVVVVLKKNLYTSRQREFLLL